MDCILKNDRQGTNDNVAILVFQSTMKNETEGEKYVCVANSNYVSP